MIQGILPFGVRAVVLSVMALTFFWGCAKPSSEERRGEKPIVFVSVLPQVDFVKRIAGDHVEVHALVGEGQDPHVYAVEPQQMIARTADDRVHGR